MNAGSSPYHAIKALYCRSASGDLLSIEGSAADAVRSRWSGVQNFITTTSKRPASPLSEHQINTTIFDVSGAVDWELCTEPSGHSHVARELYRPEGNYYVGLVSCTRTDGPERECSFRGWLETLILSQTSLRPGENTSSHQDVKAVQTAASITALFAMTLKNVPSHDEWDLGMSLFKRRVLDFVVRNERIQMSLPAFPCKSPNTRKVGGYGPDMAERIALRTLQTFAKDLRKVYSPGVTIWIVSDGHVFSDCIGVDDDVVSQYDEDVVTTYQSMCNTTADEEAIRFRGLTEMLSSNGDTWHGFDQRWQDDFEIEHPIQSNHSADAELARRIMMAGFQSSRDHFRKLVADQHKPTLSLYRGQARFMQDDLSRLDFLAKTPKQKKKTSFLVAAEMILRNQAYSNMLEVLLPNYVRLSIHAHTNRGPKFGICLLPRDQVCAIDSVFDRHTLCPSYEFQVPTPWHNSIIKIEGDSKVYLGKAEIVHNAIAEGGFEGGWVEDNVQGGHFAIRPTRGVCDSPATTQASSMISVEYTDDKQSAMAKSEIVEISDAGDAPSGKKVGLALMVRDKLFSIISQLSRFLAKLVSRDDVNKKSIGHGAAIASS